MTRENGTKAAVLAALVAACGGSGGSGPDGGPMDAARDADVAPDGAPGDGPGDAAAQGASLAVRVFTLDPGAVGVPIADAQVAFERPGGGREERATDATGVATFTGIDWSRGRGAVTAWRAGRVAGSMTNLDGRRAEVELGLVALPPTARLRGSLTNPAAGATQFRVSATNALSASTTGASFEVEVPRGEPFGLVFMETSNGARAASGRGFTQSVLRWSEAGHAALAADAREDVDLANTRALTPTPFRATLELPAAVVAQLATNYVGFAAVQAARGGPVSAVTRTDAARMEGPVEVAGEYVRPAGVATLFRQYVVLLDGTFTGRTAAVIEEGAPPAAATVSTFLPVPELGDVPFPLGPHAPIPVRSHPAGAPLGAVMLRDGAFVWYVIVDGDGASVAFPALPSRAAADPAFGDGDFEVRVRTCEAGPRDVLCRRASVAEALPLSGRPR